MYAIKKGAFMKNKPKYYLFIALAIFLAIIIVSLLVQKPIQTIDGDIIQYGEQTNTTKALQLFNKTGQDVTLVSAMYSNDEAETTLETKNEDNWKNDAKAAIHLNKKSTNENPITCDLSIMLLDDTYITIHNINIENIDSYKDAKLCINAEKIGYLEYTDSNGNTVNTLTEEKAIFDEINTPQDDSQNQEIIEEEPIPDEVTD